MKQIEDDIRKFMTAAGQATPGKPTIPDEKTRLLRAKLIFEEALEQVSALGVDVSQDGVLIYDNGYLDYEIVDGCHLALVADGAADQIYVSIGTTIACGIEMQPIWDLVQAANMAKFGPGSSKDPQTGKVLKPPGWMAPDAAIAKEISKQSWNGESVADEISRLNGQSS